VSTYITRTDVLTATSRLMGTARGRSEGQARRVLARLWSHRDGVLVGLTVPDVPPSFAGALTRRQRRWLLDTGRRELAALPHGMVTPMVRLHASRFYGGSGALDPGQRHVRRLTFPMLVALLGIDAGRVIATELAGKRIPPVEQLDARRPDPEEAARVHGRQLARLARQRAAQRVTAGPAVRRVPVLAGRVTAIA